MDYNYEITFRRNCVNSVGIDISKDESTVCILRPFGEVVSYPYGVRHTDIAL